MDKEKHDFNFEDFLPRNQKFCFGYAYSCELETYQITILRKTIGKPCFFCLNKTSLEIQYLNNSAEKCIL